MLNEEKTEANEKSSTSGHEKLHKTALLIYAAVFPLVLFVSLERLNPVSSVGLFSGSLISVIFNTSYPGGIGVILFSALFLLAVALVFFGLIGSVFWSYAIVTVVALIMYIVNYFKLSITGGVFVHTDILLAGAAFGVMEGGTVNIPFSFVVGAVFVLSLLTPLWFVKIKPRFPWRIAISVLTIAVGAVFLTGEFAVYSLFPALGIDQNHSINARYKNSGFLLGFYSVFIERTLPLRVNMEYLALLTEEPPVVESGLPDEDYAPVLPNVIVIMSEAFMDPTLLENISFSTYPIPNFRRIAQEGISGNVLVPVYGGGTANTEFEFLSGNPHFFFGSRFYVPYENPDRYFFREIRTALPWLFRENGYRALAIHPYYGDFFNRNRIYPLLGFEYFITQEHMPYALRKGPYISDEYMTDRIIEEILRGDADDIPLFLFAISMQNHWGFDPMKYGTLELDVMSESPVLDENQTGIMNSFLQGVFDADRELGRLVDFVSEMDRPTIIVFFGDHLPILGLHSDRIFEELGWLTHQGDELWTMHDHMNLFQTPYLVWANYDIGLEDWGNMSVFMLSAFVAEASGIRLNRYYTYLLNARRYFRGIINELYIDADGGFHPIRHNRRNPHVLALRALWYENIFGEGAFHESLAEVP